MSRSEPRRGARLVPLFVLVSLALGALACGPKLTPEEQIELLRSQYTAELKSLTVKQDPVAAVSVDGAAPTGTGEAAAGETASAVDGAADGEAPNAADEPAATETLSLAAGTPAGDGAATDALAAGAGPAVKTDVILDILVSTTSQEYLPGITIDVEHVDADRRVKGRRVLWVDTAGLIRGGGTQVTHVLENVDWQAGDGFAAEVRTPVPADQRGEYREFQSP